MKQLFAIAALAAVFSAQTPAPPLIAVRAARLIDGRGGAPIAPAVVLVRGERIEAVGAGLPIPAGARIIDLGGATLLPGLIDLHTHLTSTGVHWEDELLKTTPGQAALHGARNALVTLIAGFTTCRDMGPTWPYTDIDLRKAIDEGVVPGPRLMVAGNYVSATGGAGDARQFSIYVDVPIVRNLADGPDEIRKAVRTNLKAGADFIKILATGAVLSKGTPPGAQQYTEEELRVAVEEAARWGTARRRACARHRRHQGGDPRRHPHHRSRQHDGRRGGRAAADAPCVLRADAVHERVDLGRPQRAGVGEGTVASRSRR